MDRQAAAERTDGGTKTGAGTIAASTGSTTMAIIIFKLGG
jgi:hypothetical protein